MTVALAAGAVLGGRYALTRCLGEGTFGWVWRAEDTRLGRRAVAVKVLKPQFEEEPDIVARFENEAMALALLSHPNVVGVLDRGVSDGVRWMATELVDGQPLDAWLEGWRERGELPPVRTVVEIFDGIAQGVEAAHSIREPGPIVHRDLKPANVIVRERAGAGPTVKVLDFGIAQLGSRKQTRTGMMMGTPLYMAPEQAIGRVRAIGPASDVFALGAILFELLTGSSDAGEGETFWGLALHDPAALERRLRASRADVPSELWDVIVRAMKPEPEARYAEAGALRHAVTAALSERVSLAQALDATAYAPSRPLPQTRVSTEPRPEPPASQPVSGADAATDRVPRAPLAKDAQSTGPVEVVVSAPPAGARAPASRSLSAALGVAAVALVLGVGWAVAGSGLGSSSEAAPALAAADPLAAPPPPPEPRSPSAPAPPPAAARPTCSEGFVLVGAADGDGGAFCLNRNEVTASEYGACVATGDCQAAEATVTTEGLDGGGRRFWSTLCNSEASERGAHPMNCVTWHEASAFCTAHAARLPTEAELRRAAVGAPTRAYPWGEGALDAERANACGAECAEMATRARQGVWPTLHAGNDGFGATAPVGAFPLGASPEGALDLAGNVWEWTASSPADDPLMRVALGGSFADAYDANFRASASVLAPGSREATVGFRCASGPRLAEAAE